MSEERKKDVYNVLETIVDPDTNKSIVELGFISRLSVKNNSVFFHLHLPPVDQEVRKDYQKFVESVVQELTWVEKVTTILAPSAKKSAADAQYLGLSQVKHIIAVSSCKGGVGKSTVAVNLAFSLALSGKKVGIFDADIYGPSLPTMIQGDFGELEPEGDLLKPFEYSGVKLMSFGYTQEKPESSAPAILRGPIVSQVLNQMLTGTQWGELDYLIIDMPPGTGDIQITLTQLLPITGSVLVTTPQKISVVDVEKGVEMFDKVNVPTIAVVENQSYFLCNDCDKKHYIYGKGPVESLKKKFAFKHAIELPIEPSVSEHGDKGIPFVIGQASSESAKVFSSLAKIVIEETEILKNKQAEQPYVQYVASESLIRMIGQNGVKTITPFELRTKCQCAECVDEFTGDKILDETKVPKDIEPLTIKPVGNYAVGISWSDAHSSLMPFSFLSSL